MDYDYFEVGRRIAKRRKARGYSQQKLAELARTSHGTLCKVEQGKFNPSIDMLVNIANVLDVSMSDLLGTDGEIVSLCATCTDREKKLLIRNWKNVQRLLRAYEYDEENADIKNE